MNASLLTPARKGARNRPEIPAALLTQLHRGEIETASLSEGRLIDFGTLLKTAVPGLPPESIEKMNAARDAALTRRMTVAGALLLEHFGAAVYLRLVHHRSDLVRGWAAYVLSAATDFSVGERLRIIRSLAGDHNAAVRDWAWLSMRPHVAADVPHTLALLQPWTAESSPFLRRFASEITRPRGVWCQPLRELEREPEIALPLLEALRADPHRYVQNSVAHWLGDAARTQRSWVESLCARWKKESPGEATQWICRRSMRLAS